MRLPSHACAYFVHCPYWGLYLFAQSLTTLSDILFHHTYFYTLLLTRRDRQLQEEYFCSKFRQLNDGDFFTTLVPAAAWIDLCCHEQFLVLRDSEVKEEIHHSYDTSLLKS